MRYQGDADGGAAPGGQERPPGRPGPSWPGEGDSDQPGRSGADWQPDADRPGTGTTGTRHPGGWYSDAGRGGASTDGREYAGSWPAADDSGAPGSEHTASWFPDADRTAGGTSGTEYAGSWPAADDGGTPGTEYAGGWFPHADGGTSGGEHTGSWPADTDGGTSGAVAAGAGHTGSWYSDGGYSDAGYGYDDGAYGSGHERADPAAGAGADLMTAGVVAGGPGPADGTKPGATDAGAAPAGAIAGDRGLAASGAAQPGSEPAGDVLYGAAGGTAGKGPVRGYPPAPGQSDPVYPPGQFAAWNQPPAGTRDGRAVAEAWPGAASAEHGYAEPVYSVLAVSDPAADATSTQTWAVADDQRSGSWRDMHARAGPATGTERVPAARPGGAPDRDRRAMAPAGHQDQAASRDGMSQQHAPGAVRTKTKPLPRRPRPGAPGGPPERGTRGSSRGRRGRKPAGGKRVRVLLAAGLAVVVAAGTGTYFYLAGHRQASHPVAAPRSTPSATQPDQPSASPTPTGRWGHIQTRQIDPQKLTLHQLFPVRFSTSGSGYTRTAAKAGKHCTSAVLGSRLQSAVSAAGCTQVMRASYLADSRKLMGTIGVLNLRSARLASRAGGAAGPSQFISQLRGAKGPTRRLNKGTGIEEAEVKGHYLILIWAEFTSLHAPKHAAQKKELVQFCNRLIKNTANVSLSRRLVTGRP